MAKRLIKRIKQLEERIEELQRIEELPGDRVEAWAKIFAAMEGQEITEEHLDTAMDFVVHCLKRCKEPTWVELVKLANSNDDTQDEAGAG